MGKRSCVNLCCCCKLQPGILIGAILLSVVFGIGVSSTMLMISNESSLLIYYWLHMHVRFYGVLIPRFIAFWIAYNSNTNGKINTRTRWCLAFVYLFTQIIYAVNELWAVWSW